MWKERAAKVLEGEKRAFCFWCLCYQCHSRIIQNLGSRPLVLRISVTFASLQSCCDSPEENLTKQASEGASPPAQLLDLSWVTKVHFLALVSH